MEFCEFCGNILNDDGRCPWDDCPHNAIIDAMAEAKKADEQKEKTDTVQQTSLEEGGDDNE